MNRFTREQMAARVARDIPNGAYVNLGIGLPTMVANHLPPDREIILHTRERAARDGTRAGGRRRGSLISSTPASSRSLRFPARRTSITPTPSR